MTYIQYFFFFLSLFLSIIVCIWYLVFFIAMVFACVCVYLKSCIECIESWLKFRVCNLHTVFLLVRTRIYPAMLFFFSLVFHRLFRSFIDSKACFCLLIHLLPFFFCTRLIPLKKKFTYFPESSKLNASIIE